MEEVIISKLNARAAILDGEMIVWDTEAQKCVPFGMNKTIALSDKEDAGSRQLLYMIFDILYIQGAGGADATLLSNTLRDRLTILHKALPEEVEGTLEIIKGRISSSIPHI